MFLVFISGCEEYDIGEVIFKEDIDFTGSPVITAIEPADGADVGVRVITIHGENFISQKDSIPFVYIGAKKSLLKSISDTRIEIYRPTVYGDSLTIRLKRNDGWELGTVENYRIDRAVEPYQEINENGLARFYAIAMDADTNMYISSSDLIYILHPPSPAFAAETLYAETEFRALTDMKMGPGGYLYILSGDTNIYRIEPVTFTTDTFALFHYDLSKFDFDANHNLYVGSDSGLTVVFPDGQIKAEKQGYETGFTFQSIRVYSGFVYLAARYNGSEASYPSAGIWRSEIINSSGDLGDEELYFSYSGSGDFADGTIAGITFTNNGDMYVGVNGHPTHPIWIIHPDLSYEPLYQDTGFFNFGSDRQVNQIIIGNDNYLYLLRAAPNATSDHNRIIRFGLPVEGAPYYGIVE